jgi:hypothetical protein
LDVDLRVVQPLLRRHSCGVRRHYLEHVFDAAAHRLDATGEALARILTRLRLSESVRNELHHQTVGLRTNGLKLRAHRGDMLFGESSLRAFAHATPPLSPARFDRQNVTTVTFRSGT